MGTVWEDIDDTPSKYVRGGHVRASPDKFRTWKRLKYVEAKKKIRKLKAKKSYLKRLMKIKRRKTKRS